MLLLKVKIYNLTKTGVKDPHSCTILIKGPNKFTIEQIKDAIRDGLHAVTNAIEDKVVLPGGGCFEVALYTHLTKFSKSVKGRAQLGVKCFADAMLIVPKTLAQNSGFDVLDTLLMLQQEHEDGNMVGLDLFTGLPMDPVNEGVFDNYRVKQQIIDSTSYTTIQLLYIDEILRAGKQRQKLE
jgi:T-complex protein 1 subunit zeta